MEIDEECWFVQPVPAFCVKFKGSPKVFINVVTTEQMPQPTDITEDDLAAILDSSDPGSFTIPISVGLPHSEVDKSGQNCTAFDVILNTTFYHKRIVESELFQHFLVLISADAVDNKYQDFDLKSRRTEWTILKNRKHVGEILPQRIRKEGKRKIKELDADGALPEEASKVEAPAAVVEKKPKYNLAHKLFGKTTDGQHIFECRVQLSDAHSIDGLNLKVNEDTIVLHCRNDELLKVCLPALVNTAQVTSEFDEKCNELVIILPLQDL